jgi:radical SAM protein with 4Fe4S-binding SPASM domain
MAIWWDGTILPCNHDDDGIIALGNIREISIKDSWQAVSLNDIRNKHRDGIAHTVPACDGCYLRDSEITKLMDRKSELKKP